MSTKNVLLSAMLLFLFGQVLWAQVTGTVVDENNKPVNGADVTVSENTEESTTTGADGTFSINAEVGETLDITHPDGGFASFPVTGSNMGSLTVNSGLEIEVDLGFVNQNEAVISSAVVSLKSEDILKNTPVTSIDNALQGKAAGVQVTAQNGKPGQSAVVRIRGLSSISGSGPVLPLYVVDGAFMSAAEIGAINNNDVESVNVLKDGASTALYGSRGANGVVIITTKNAKAGRTKFNFTSSYGVGRRIDDPFDMMNASQKLDYEQQLIDLGASLTQYTDAEKELLRSYDHDWKEDILRNSFIQNYSFQALSGDDNTSFLASFSYNEDDGIIQVLDGWHRISGRINVSQKLKYTMSIGANIGMSYEETDEPRDRYNVQNPFYAIYGYNPFETVYQRDSNGNIIYDANGNPEWNLTRDGFQILEALRTNPEEQRTFRAFGNVFFNIDKLFLDGLSFRSQLSSVYTRYQREYYYQPGSILDGYVGDPNNPGGKTDNGFDDLDYTWLNSVNYKRSFGSHNFDATLFSQYNHYNRYSYSLSSIGFPTPLLNVQSIAGAPDAASTNRTDYAFMSYGFSLSYDYMEKYFLTASITRDGSSRFGSENRFGTFPGISVGWNIAKENFVNWSNLDKLKLRASYGENGSAANSPIYNSTNVIFPTYNNQNAAANSLLVSNPALGWEVSKKIDLGLEFSLFKGRITGVIDYFKDTRSDFIFNDDLAVEGGSYNSTINAGEFVNKGWEFSLNADIIRNSGKGFNWSVYGNITLLDSEITDLNGLEEQIISGTTRHVVGEEPFSYFFVRYAGVDAATGQALYYDANGNITNVYSGDDAVLLEGKSPLADFYGGFGTNFRYQNFDLGLDFVYQYGNYIFNYVAYDALDPASATDNRSTDAFNYWQQPGDTDVLPRPVNPDGTLNNFDFSDQFLQDGSYLRLRTVNLGYTFDRSILGNLPIDNLRIFFQAQNLLTWTAFDGNPEVGIGSGENQTTTYVPGEFALYSYPAQMQLLFGLELNF